MPIYQWQGTIGERGGALWNSKKCCCFTCVCNCWEFQYTLSGGAVLESEIQSIVSTIKGASWSDGWKLNAIFICRQRNPPPYNTIDKADVLAVLKCCWKLPRGADVCDDREIQNEAEDLNDSMPPDTSFTNRGASACDLDFLEEQFSTECDTAAAPLIPSIERESEFPVFCD